MVTEDFLIKDEKEAIDGYNTYLNQGVRNPKIIPIIRKIIADEKRHIILLNKVKRMKKV